MSIDRIPLPSTPGRLWLGGRDDIAPDPEAALAWADGASTIVCLVPVQELQGRVPAYVDWLRAHVGGRALWYPVHNDDAPSAEYALPFLRMITARLEAGEGVVVHCTMGRGRAGTIATCVLMLLGASVDDALRTVAIHRPFAGPNCPGQWRLVGEISDRLGR